MDPEQLLKDCLKNNRKAQEALYRYYAPDMLGICYRYTKSLDDAEDVLQEGFVKVFTQLKQYRGEGALGGWIRSIMVRTALSYLRRHNRYRNHLDLDDASPLHPVASETPATTLQADQLVEMIRRLPVGYQTVFNLVGVEGFSHAEAAAMLGIHENTSRSQYSRARALLMRWVEEEDRRVARL